MLPDAGPIRLALTGKCPRCGKGALYRHGFLNLNLNDRCPECGLNLAANDNGDGPAVFLIFILGFTIVPLAILLEYAIHPPLWLHAVLWGIVLLGLTIGMLKPLKAYIIALEFKHRRGTWKE